MQYTGTKRFATTLKKSVLRTGKVKKSNVMNNKQLTRIIKVLMYAFRATLGKKCSTHLSDHDLT